MTVLLASRSARRHSLEVHLSHIYSTVQPQKCTHGPQLCHPLNLSSTPGFCPSRDARSRCPGSSSQPHRCTYREELLFQSQVTSPVPSNINPPTCSSRGTRSRPAREPTSISPGCTCCLSSRPLGTRQAAIKEQVSAAQQTRLPSGRQEAHFGVSAFSLKDPRSCFSARHPPQKLWFLLREATRLTGSW